MSKKIKLEREIIGKESKSNTQYAISKYLSEQEVCGVEEIEFSYCQSIGHIGLEIGQRVLKCLKSMGGLSFIAPEVLVMLMCWM